MSQSPSPFSWAPKDPGQPVQPPSPPESTAVSPFKAALSGLALLAIVVFLWRPAWVHRMLFPQTASSHARALAEILADRCSRQITETGSYTLREEDKDPWGKPYRISYLPTEDSPPSSDSHAHIFTTPPLSELIPLPPFSKEGYITISSDGPDGKPGTPDDIYSGSKSVSPPKPAGLKPFDPKPGLEYIRKKHPKPASEDE